MTSPQLEDGYARIANEILDAIAHFDFGKRHYKIILFVFRKTYGWSKKSDIMSLSQIMEGTGLARGHACNAINDLCAMKVLLKQEHQKGQLIEFNKKHKEWVVLPKREQCYQNGNEVLPKQYQSVTETVTEVLPKQYPQKKVLKTLSKDTTKRHIAKVELSPEESVFQMACRSTWEAYKKSFFKRYGVDPVRNAKINSQVRAFVSRIGNDESPFIAGWFLDHNDSFYVRSGHVFGLLVKDAEKLRTEWATGKMCVKTFNGSNGVHEARAKVANAIWGNDRNDERIIDVTPASN